MSDSHDSCLEIENHLPLWAGGDLEPDVRAAVDTHLSRCEPCTRAAGRARAARAALERGLREGSERRGIGRDPWPAIRASLRAEGLIGGPAPAPALRPIRRRFNPAWPVAAAVLVGLFLAGTWLPSGDDPRVDPTEVVGSAKPPKAQPTTTPVAALPVGLRRLAPTDPRMRDTAWLFRPATAPDAAQLGHAAPLAPERDWSEPAGVVSQERVQLLPPR